MTEGEMVARSGIMNEQYGQSVALPRNPIWPNVPFNPGNPLIPGAINPVREDGRADPRRYEYQVAQNINITPTRLIPFTTLRSTADHVVQNSQMNQLLKQHSIYANHDEAHQRQLHH